MTIDIAQIEAKTYRFGRRERRRAVVRTNGIGEGTPGCTATASATTAILRSSAVVCAKMCRLVDAPAGSGAYSA